MMLCQVIWDDIVEFWCVCYVVIENMLMLGCILDVELYVYLEDYGCGWVVEFVFWLGLRIVGFFIGDVCDGNIWVLFVDLVFVGYGYGCVLYDVMVDWLFFIGFMCLNLGIQLVLCVEVFYCCVGWWFLYIENYGECCFELFVDDWKICYVGYL